MIGCVAGEGHIDQKLRLFIGMPLLAAEICALARRLNVQLIVLKEFLAEYRSELKCFEPYGFKRVPSMPMTKLNIDYASFDEYVAHCLSAKTRRTLRRKLRIADKAAPIRLTVVRDVSEIIHEVYPLYLQVFERSKLKFEKLTPQFFTRIGQIMPDKVRFFLWRQHGKLIAFSLAMVEGDSVYGECIGFDYNVAFDLHLYYYAFRDTVNWAIANGYKTFRSGGLNYDPKLHLRHVLDPLDLYVRHTNPVMNGILRVFLPLMVPARYDRVLQQFPNYRDLWHLL